MLQHLFFLMIHFFIIMKLDFSYDIEIKIIYVSNFEAQKLYTGFSPRNVELLSFMKLVNYQ